MKVLFVCTGNICRSPMAEGFFNHSVTEERIADMEVDSAGTCTMNGSQPSYEAQLVAEENGFSITELKSRQIVQSDIDKFDILFVMTNGHKQWIENNFGPSEKVVLLGTYLNNSKSPEEINDPIGFDADYYRSVFAQIKLSIINFINELKQNV